MTDDNWPPDELVERWCDEDKRAAIRAMRKAGLLTTDSDGTWVHATEILRLVEEVGA